MNCKPNELARVVRSGNLVLDLFIDRIVLTTVPRTMQGGAPGWLIAEPMKVVLPFGVVDNSHTYFPGDSVVLIGIADAHLRPIRGDEGTDETLIWKAVPSTPVADKVTS